MKRDAVILNVARGGVTAALQRKMADYKRPRWIEFVPDLPKTATGKMQRFKLRG